MGIIWTPNGGYTIIPDYKWEACYTLIPRKLNGKWFWPGQTVYRIFVDRDNGYYRYGTILDVLKDTQ
jgi:hypothetical protein